MLQKEHTPWNISKFARRLAEVRPVHTYWSYQSYLQKNMYERHNLLKRLLDRGVSLPPAAFRRNVSTRLGTSLPMQSRNDEEENEVQSMVAPVSKVWVQEVRDASLSSSSTASSLESLEELFDEANDEANDEAMISMQETSAMLPTAQNTSTELGQEDEESEEEEMDEDDVLAFEAHMHANTNDDFVDPTEATASPAPKSGTQLPTKRLSRSRLSPASERGLIEMLVHVLDEAPAASTEDAETLAAQPVPTWIWDRLCEKFPEHALPAWQRYYERNKVMVWQAALDQYSLRATPSTIFPSSSTPVRQAPPAPRDEAPTPARPRRTTRSSVLGGMPAAAAPTQPPVPVTAPTPEVEEAASSTLHTPQSQAIPPAFTPATVRVGQRSGHREAKVIARAEGRTNEGTPSPSMERKRPRTSSLSPDLSTSSAPVQMERTRHPPSRAEEMRARAQYEAHVWALCADYGFVSPRQLMPYMIEVGGDVEQCRRKVQKHMEHLARQYQMETLTIIELLDAHHGNVEQLMTVMNIQQRARARQFSRTHSNFT